MNYQETLDWMFAQLPMFQRKGQAAYKANLDNTHALDAHFLHPHKNYKTIHVAGTNGKGSVSHFLASCLQEAGYKTGLYTSPHLKDFRERIRVGGIPVSKNFVVDFIDDNTEMFSEMKPSFFEMTVAMAFKYFEEEEVDYAIIETGLGGRLDSTNIISPEISIITNISLDHTALLGNDLKSIAKEKAGIIKADIPAVVGEYDDDVADVFIEKAKDVSTNISFADQNYSIANSSFDVLERTMDVLSDGEILFKSLKSSLVGVYQEKNVITAIAALMELRNSGMKIDNKHIVDGIREVVENTGIMGRWQILNKTPLTICDTAHNEAGIACVLDQINQVDYDKLHVVFGMVNDKSIDTVLSMMPKDAIYYFTKASIPRAMDECELKEIASKYNLKGDTYENVEKAVSAATEMAQKNDLVYIGGSTFVVAEIV